MCMGNRRERKYGNKKYRAEMKSISIIVPCFNEEKWIQHTILGCINQDYPIDKLEVIVVDDCSNDHSVDKIKEIIKERRA